MRVPINIIVAYSRCSNCIRFLPLTLTLAEYQFVELLLLLQCIFARKYVRCCARRHIVVSMRISDLVCIAQEVHGTIIKIFEELHLHTRIYTSVRTCGGACARIFGWPIVY